MAVEDKCLKSRTQPLLAGQGRMETVNSASSSTGVFDALVQVVDKGSLALGNALMEPLRRVALYPKYRAQRTTESFKPGSRYGEVGSLPYKGRVSIATLMR